MEAEAADLDRFPHPHLAVDVALFTVRANALHVLLLRRREKPFAGRECLPGGFVRIAESLDEAAARVLDEKCGLQNVFVEQLYTFGDPKRDPRGRVVSAAHFALVAEERLANARGETSLFRVEADPKREGEARVFAASGDEARLGFDHDRILGAAVRRLRGKLDYAPVGFELLPAEFTLFDLQRVHEAVLGTELNKDSFRRRILASGMLRPTGRRFASGPFRPAALYRFKAAKSFAPLRRGTPRRKVES
jgi:8-oxo-dGTP diphosphatase